MAKKIFIGSTEIAGLNGIGSPGPEGVGISSVVQTTESTVSGGTNVITVTKTDGTTSTFNVRNGDAVGSATIVQTTGDSTTAAMSQDGTTKAIAAGAQSVKTGTSMMFPNKTVTKLSATQVAALNAAEEITIKWVLKDAASPGGEHRYVTVLGMMPYYQVAFSSFNTISVVPSLNASNQWIGKHVNGDTSQTHYYNWANQCVIINRVTGRVRWYQNTTLLVDETSNDYKADKFVDTEGYLNLYSGDNSTRFYALQVYDYDMSKIWRYPSTNNQMNSISWIEGCGNTVPALIANNFRSHGYALVTSGGTVRQAGFYGASGQTASGGNGWDGNPYYITFTEGTSVAGTSKVGLGYSHQGYCCEIHYWLTIAGGTFSLNRTYIANLFDPNIIIYDGNGDEISDYTSIGPGDYEVVFTAVKNADPYLIYRSGSPTITITQTGYKPVCCVIDMRMDTLYDGKLIDNEAGTEYPLYYHDGNSYTTIQNGWNNKRDAQASLSQAPFLSIYDANLAGWYNTAAYAPVATGDIVIKNGVIYYGDAINRVWKQINNA